MANDLTRPPDPADRLQHEESLAEEPTTKLSDWPTPPPGLAEGRTPSMAEIHADHVKWNQGNLMWRDDIDAWKMETERAFRELMTMLDVEWRQHLQALDSHYQTILEEAAALKRREADLAEVLREGLPNVPESIVEAHGAATTIRMIQQRVHERLKRRQHALVSRLSSFFRSIAQISRS